MKKSLILIGLIIFLFSLNSCSNRSNDTNVYVKKDVTITACDVVCKYNEEITTNGYEITKGNIDKDDLDDLNIEVVVYKYKEMEYNYYRYPQVNPNIACIYYDVVGIEYDEHQEYNITVERGDLTVVNYCNNHVENPQDYSDIIVWDGTSTNDYSQTFFEKQEGFLTYNDLLAKTNQYDILSEEYIPPLDLKEYDINSLDSFIEAYPDKIIDLATAGRYSEEIFRLSAPIQYRYAIFKNKLQNLEYVATWDFSKPVEDWILYRFDLELSDYEEEMETLSPYEYVVNEGYNGSESEFIKILQEEIPSKIERSLSQNGFYGYIETLAYTLYKHPTYYQDVLSVYDKDYYQQVLEQVELYDNALRLADEKSETALYFDEYVDEYLLGFGGILTPFPNKPMFTSVNEVNNIVEFYFNYANTSFKIIEKDLNNNIINTWYSNPQSPDASFDVFTNEERMSQIQIICSDGYNSYIYSNNYTESVSNSNMYNDILNPTYSIYLETDDFGNASKLIVCYNIKRRYVDYTYFPKYISASKMNEYFERNARLAETQDQYDSEGNLITNLMDDENKMQFVYLTKQFYTLIEADDPRNQFGYAYYEYYGQMESMSGMVRSFLYKSLYEWCGYTEEDLISDNQEFNYETKKRPEFQITLEYQLINGKLHVSMPKNSLFEDSTYPFYNINLFRYFYKEE